MLSGSVEFAGGPLGGTTDYVKYEGSASKHFPLIWDTAFSLRGVVGYVDSFGGEEVPLYERFFLGGINTLRGFETRAVGPRDPLTGEAIGGTTEAVLNVEYIFPILAEQNVRGVIFYDTGNAYDGSIDLSDMRHGAGAGIRWYSPMGPIRIEWGYNLDRREDEEQSLWEFTIGGTF